MGAADVVPGVSGGTVAFITGIYERLIDALGAVNLHFIRLLIGGQWQSAWRHIDGTFLLLVFGGVLVSVISLAKLMSWLLVNQPKMIWSYFFGLILASVVYLAGQVQLRQWQNLVMFILGSVVAYQITLIAPVQVEPTGLTIFGAGAIAICAMILPGISGSFILVILGMYEPIINALKAFDGSVLGLFVLGCITGLLSFTHLLSWLLHRYHELVLALLTGFMLGSLNKVWPWKHTDNVAGKLIERNLGPGQYETLVQADAQVLIVVAMVTIGLLTVYAINYAGNVRSR